MGSQFIALTQAPAHDLSTGVRMRPLFGEGAMLNLLDFDPGASVPLHSHPHEQMGIVLEGSLVFLLDDGEHVLGVGDAYQLSGGVEHAVQTRSEGARALDIFQPVRDDYRELVAGQRQMRQTLLYRRT